MTASDSDVDIQSLLNVLSGEKGWIPRRPKPSFSQVGSQPSNEHCDHPLTILAMLGGLASARSIGKNMSTNPSVRMVRDRLKDWTEVRKIGGGFYKLLEHPSPSLHDWLVARMGNQRIPIDRVIDAIVREWPHPDPTSIRGWVHQDPGRVRHSRGEVWIHRSWRPRR